jgi:hypothetical protein
MKAFRCSIVVWREAKSTQSSTRALLKVTSTQEALM